MNWNFNFIDVINVGASQKLYRLQLQ